MRKLYPLFILLGLFGLSAATANAAQLASAKVLSVSGTVTTYSEGGAETPLQAGAILSQGDSISTNPSSQAVLVFSNGSELTVMENSRLTLAELSQEAFGGTKSYEQLQADPSRSQTLLKLNYGKTSGHVKKLSDGSQFLVESPLGTAAIRGTNFTVALNFDPTSGLYSLQVSNQDGLVDFITNAEGSQENGDYDPNATETTTAVPAEQEFAVSISADDPNFDTVIEQMINLTRAATDDGAVIAPTVDEIQLTAEIVMMAFMAGIQADPTIDADEVVSSVIANVSSAVLSATVKASGDASPEAIAAASKGVVGAAAAASSGTDIFAATVAAASSGAITGAVTATADSTTSATEAIQAASSGAVTGAVEAAEKAAESQGDDVQGEDSDNQGEVDPLVAAAAQAAASGATEGAVNSAEGLDDQLAALQAATTGATEAAIAESDELGAEIAAGATAGATEAGLSSEQAEAAVENATQETTNSPAEGEDQGADPVVTPDVGDTEEAANAKLQADVTELVKLAREANPDLDLSDPVAVQQAIEALMAESYLLVPVPTAAEIQIIAETVMMAFMAEIQADPDIDANAVIANVSSAILTATVAGLEAAAAAAPEGSSTASVTAAIKAASTGIVGAAAAASSGSESFAATVAAASSGATTGAVTATAGSTTSSTEAIQAASGGAVTGAVAATEGSTTSSTEAIQAASNGAVTGAVSSHRRQHHFFN